jgi:hypothetical protein
MFNNYLFSVEERFLRYVQIDTQSDPYSEILSRVPQNSLTFPAFS